MKPTTIGLLLILAGYLAKRFLDWFVGDVLLGDNERD